MPEARLPGQRVLLVGAEEALLRATRGAFEATGARLAVIDRAPRSDAVEQLVIDAAGSLGGLDICVHFSRPRVLGALLEVPASSWAADLESTLLESYRLSQAAARVMAAGAGGSIVLVGSLDAFHAYAGRSTAAVAMTGSVGLVRALGVELAGAGIRANAIFAGPLGDDDGRPPPGSDAALTQRALLRSPSGRFVTPREVAAAITFVAGPRAAFMTGQALRVDAGWASLNQAPDGMKFP